MEAAGLVLGVVGVVGVLGQVFDGCVKAYRIFTTASNLGRDSERLVCKIRIEEMRFVCWGKECGLAEGKLESSLVRHGRQDGLHQLAEMILKELYQTIMDLNKLQNRYGLREESPGSVDKEAYKKSSDPTRPSMKLRARWVISDKEKFGLFLDDLQYFNDKLEKLFSPEKIANLQRIWTNELLHNASDLNTLDLLSTASQPGYPSLSAYAQLKQLRINLDARAPNNKMLSSSALKIPSWRLEYDSVPATATKGSMKTVAGRTRAVFKRPSPVSTILNDSTISEEVSVFVEWTDFDEEVCQSLDDRLQLLNRVDALARMLVSSHARHPDLHTLDCVGYVEESSNMRYGIVYSLPSFTNGSTISSLSTGLGMQTVQSLADLLTKESPDLDVRFKLAHTLAVALWSCHSLDWLHKTLCPHNVLFFTTNTTNSELSKPYLAGFDSSRPEHISEMTAPPRNSAGENLYRHPSSLGAFRESYRKGFDIYSLGLILLEIGLWKRIDVVHKPKYSPSDFRERICRVVVPALGSKCGARYRTAVEACLMFDSGEAGGSQPMTSEALKGTSHGITPHQILESVVGSLESLKV